MRLRATAVALVAASALAAPGLAGGAIQVARAELSAGRLRVEGLGAMPNASIFLDGTARAIADGAGRFRAEVGGFSSASCKVTVGDGFTSARATLTGCAPVPLGKPSFALKTLAGLVGETLRYQGEGSGSELVAFVYDWGDGTRSRDPATGFYAVVPASGAVAGATVEHAWSAAGSFPVTVTAVDPGGGSAVSDPITVTISASPQQNDCGGGGDAGNSLATALPITFPVTCSGGLAWNASDMTDVYRFTVSQPFRLLTLTVAPPGLWNCCPPEIGLVDPAGTLRGDVAVKTLCAEPQVLCETAATLPIEKTVGYTLDVAGEWRLVLGGDIATIGRSTFVTGTYSFSLHAGGGGDDCVQGRSPALTAPPPVDAPNEKVGIRLLDAGETNCTGSLPFLDRDFHDGYVFPVLEGEPVVVSVTSTDGFPPCSGRIWGSLVVPGVRGASFPFGCVGDALFNPGAAGDAGIDLQARWSARTEALGHRIRVATGSRHGGDCFTGADAAGSHALATPMPVSACVGDVGAADPDDWYSFGVAVGEEIAVAAVPCGCALNAVTPPQPILPVELYDPDGLLRQPNPQAKPFVADKAGGWRLRVATAMPNVPRYEGPYGFQVRLRQLALTGLTLDPPRVTGGAASQGAVFLNAAPSGSVVVALSSSNPVLARVPDTVTVPPGSTVAGFTVATGAVTATTAVTISASFAGVTKTAALEVNPAATETVSVTKAEYVSAQRQLRVEAKSTSTTATLSVYLAATGELVGTLQHLGGGKYGAELAWLSDPERVIVRSSLGGQATANVTTK